MPASDTCEVLISVNPVAGAKASDRDAHRLAELLDNRGYRARVLTDLDEVCQEANELRLQGRLKSLVGIGGDGTMAELVNRTDAGVPIAMAPGGTANLLSRYLGYRSDVSTWVDAVVEGRTIQLDAGRANGRLFTLMLSCGFDAEIVRRLEEGRRGHIGRLAYARPILQAMAHYDYPKILIYCGDSNSIAQREPMKVAWFFAFNLPCYGGGFRFAPSADGTDGQLDVCTFRHGSFWHGLRYFLSLVFRRHRQLADCEFFQADRFRLETEEKVPYQLDGDFAGFLPVEVEVLPKRLTVVVPPDSPLLANR